MGLHPASGRPELLRRTRVSINKPTESPWKSHYKDRRMTNKDSERNECFPVQIISLSSGICGTTAHG
ncbi:LOW QUALITY PROTEIN: hypothetical protein PHMEG_0009711 [Phytophthora megakarya]|uniref:Uncharacterized protein n=1 Tax=Phytophthora megakarya TaxID=4795 RepID=A0A225WFT7_9STRA|nr:LOW QUALITY PROTEIN: hypothetical protein PHMEG_0009711 [Phytophthora megakarya]